jgi:hypothetical protein
MQSSRHPLLTPALTIVLGFTLGAADGTTRSALAQQNEPPETTYQAQSEPQSQPALITVVAVLPPAAPLRSPAALIDDLVEVAVHRQGSLPGQGSDRQMPPSVVPMPDQAAGAEMRHNKSKSYQHVIPDVININYRPARAAAQIYMGHGSEDEAARQLDQAKYRDELTVLVTSIMLDMATALGEQPDKAKLQGETIAVTMDKLSQLVGQHEAIWAFDRMQKFAGAPNKQLTTGSSEVQKLGGIEIPVKFGQTWDVLGQQALAGQIEAKAMARDQQARNLKARLGVHENPPNPFEKTLSLLSMIPEVVATAALVGDQVLEMSNGGTREKRLTDVLSLGLQLDSRQAALSRQSDLAAAGINAGKLSGNQVLVGFASALAQRLAGQ